MIVVNVANQSDNPLPTYETEFSAGMDLRAYVKEPITLKPFERSLISTGIFIELPKGFEAQIRPRSGLALKNGVTLLNTPGTIDSDYRGEIKIILINLSDTEFVVKSGDRIAQMIVSKFDQVSWQLVDTLSTTIRGTGGFGSTGV